MLDLPDSLLELVFLAVEPPARRQVERVCRRWRDVSRSSASVLWDAISWAGSGGSVEQSQSLGSLLSWLCSRSLPPRQLRLHLHLDMVSDWMPPGADAQHWLVLGAVVAHCAPRLQQLTILQDYPGIGGLDAVTADVLELCLPSLGAWLVPCRQLRRLEVVTPHVALCPHVLRQLPALQHLTLSVNMTAFAAGGGVLLDGVYAAHLASGSLTSLDLHESGMQLQPGALASLPRLRRLAVCNLQFPHNPEEEAAAMEDFTALTECADTLEELQLHSYKEVMPPQLSVLTRLRRLLFDGLGNDTSPGMVEALGQALAQLPLLEALSLHGNFGLGSSQQQQRFWGAWRPAPQQRLRSLEVQCGAATQVPPDAARHLQHVHTLVCDWAALCKSPEMLAACGQLRSLHVVANGPPFRQSVPPSVQVPRGRVAQLLDCLAALPHLATIQFFNFHYEPTAAQHPMPSQAVRLLLEAAARLPGVRIPPVVVTGHDGVRLDLWAE